MKRSRFFPAVVAFAALSLAAGAASPGKPGNARVVTLPDLSPKDAPIVLRAADRLVWDRTTGVAVAEVPAALMPRLGNLAGSGRLTTEASLGFDDAVREFVPAYRGEKAAVRRGSHRFAVLEPVELTKPVALQLRDARRPAARSLSRDESGTCLSQGFETLPIWYENGGNWWHYEGGQPDNNAGDYFWLDTQCDAFGGSWSADAVLGGTLGSELPCGATYDYNTDSWLEYAPWITCAYQAPGAELDFYARVDSETDYDFFYYLVSVDGVNYYGYSLSGDYSDAWYLFSKDLRSWTTLGDLTAYPQFALAFVFQSDDVYNVGFGARIDNISLVTTSTVIDFVRKVGRPFRLKIHGSGFLPGARVYIDGAPVPIVKVKRSDLIVAKKGRALKAMVPRGTPVCITVVNPGGDTTPCYMFTR